MADRLGIIAGSGRLPHCLIEACKAQGRPFFVLALEGDADPADFADAPHAAVRIGAAAEGLQRLREAGVREIVMAGAVRRPSLVSLRPDWRTAKFFARIGYRALGDDGLLKAVIKELEGEGFTVVGVDQLLGGNLARAGLLGRHQPDGQAQADIEHGRAVATMLGAADVGQAVIVQQGLVLGLEAIEGTDALIERCAGLRREGPGGVLVKMAKPQQERRADLPTIGAETVVHAARAGLRGIAVEAGATLILDRPLAVETADREGLFLIGIKRP
jgi:DUF1009 family protein